MQSKYTAKSRARKLGIRNPVIKKTKTGYIIVGIDKEN